MPKDDSSELIEVASPAPRRVWEAVLSDDEFALPEHSPRWMDAMVTHGYRDVSRAYRFADDSTYLVPLVRKSGFIGAAQSASSFPRGWGIGGLVGPHASAAKRQAILRDLEGLGSRQLNIRPDPASWAKWELPAHEANATLVPMRAHVIDLDGGADEVWMRMAKSARRGTRLAERAGVQIRSGNDPLLIEEFHRLHARSVERWAEHRRQPLPVARALANFRDPKSKLAAIAQRLGDDFAVTVAYFQGNAVFATVTTYGATAHDIRSAMDRELIGKSNAGDLVQWFTLKEACERGCRLYHLGESGNSANLSLTKEKYGAQPYEYAEMRLEKLPWTKWDRSARSVVKRILGTVDD